MARDHRKAGSAFKVLYVAAEADPIIKVGGLGDVAGTLPRALRALKPAEAMGLHLDVRLAIPFYPIIADRVKDIQPVVSFEVPHPAGPIPAQAFLTHLQDLPVYLISGAPIPENEPVYSQDTRRDGEKFTFFSLAVLELARALDWPPDILHANDWHTSIAVYLLSTLRKTDPFFKNTRSILTIHNLPFMGARTDDSLVRFGIPPMHEPRLPPWGVNQPLPMGLATADQVITVSPTYSREIMTPEFGCGLQDFLRMRAAAVTGILNGLDEKMWDPALDLTLPASFDENSIEKRVANKQALLVETHLPENLEDPLFILIGRMDHQKGVDLALDGLRQVTDLPWQAVLLGTGDPNIEASARQLEAELPDRVRAIIRFDGTLARKMYAGGDMLLMPSRYEPCGIAQMIAMRYGCLPVARATGGLKDTVKDTPVPGQSTGFLFEDSTPGALAAAVRRAVAAYQSPEGWEARQRFAMAQNFSWQGSAEAYAKIYHHLCN